MPTTFSENVRAAALGAAFGAGYLLAGLFTLFEASSVRLADAVPSTAPELLTAGYACVGLWLVGAVPAAAAVRFRTVLPLGLALFDLLAYAGYPTAGDLPGSLSMYLWPAYLAVFAVVGVAEYASLRSVSERGTGPVVARRLAVGGLFAGLVGAGLWNVLPVWRVFPVRDPLPLRVENDDATAHRVSIEITNARTGEAVFTETVDVGAGESATVDAAVSYVGRYRVSGELDDGTADEFALGPQHFKRLGAILVWVDGELGRFRILGQGTGP